MGWGDDMRDPSRWLSASSPDTADPSPMRSRHAALRPPGFVAPFKVHLCWFGGARSDPRCAEVARELYEILHRRLEDNIVYRPGIEIPVEYGRELSDLLDALEARREPAAEVRLVIAILDAAAFGNEVARRTMRRALARWGTARTDEVLLPIIVGGAWPAALQDHRAIHPIGAECAHPDDPDRVRAERWTLGIRVCIAAGRALLARPAGSEPPHPHVLLSHARADGGEIAELLAAYFRKGTGVQAWLDDSLVPTGEELARQLQRASGDAVVLIVRTDGYSESPECTLELLAAKRSRAPIVTLLATVDGEVAAPAYSGNHRTMNWHRGREAEVAVRCVQAWLHGHHFRMATAAALALAGLPADSDILPRRPELLDLIGINRTGRRLVVHPDPPLTDAEATVLRTAHPVVRLATPTTLLGRVLLAQDPRPPLAGTTLAFSLSTTPELPRLTDGCVGSGLTQDHVDDLVYSIVLATLRSGTRIAYGGDFRSGESYTRFLVDLHRMYGGLGTRSSAQLICFLDQGMREGLGPRGIEFDPIDVPVPRGAERFPELHARLWHLAMREVMSGCCTGRILIGGKTRSTAMSDEVAAAGGVRRPGGYRGAWPGALEEAWRTLRHGRALYVIGGFGGVAGLIAEMLRTGVVPELLTRRHHAGSPLAALTERLDAARASLAAAGTSPEVLLQIAPGRYADIEDLSRGVLERWQAFEAGDCAAWRNGLDLEENRRLLRSTDRTEITHLVFEGLRRIQGDPDGELQLALYLGDIASVPKVDGYAVTVTPGVPSVGAAAALIPDMERQGGGAPVPATAVALHAVEGTPLSGSHVLVAQLELPPNGRSIEAATIEQIAHDLAFEANRVGLESIACPVFATSLGVSIADSAQAMIAGFRRGRGHHPAKLVFCEIDRDRYDRLHAALGPGPTELRRGAPIPLRIRGPLLHVDVDVQAATGAVRARVTLYVPDANQPVAPRHEVALAAEQWDALRQRIDRFEETIRVGRMLWRDLLSDDIRALLLRYHDLPLVLLGDEAASSIPWELLIEDRDGAPPRRGGVVRRIALSGAFRSPADQVERSRLRVLVVADPRSDLRSARPESDMVCAALAGRADVTVKRLDGAQATVAAVRSELEHGFHDVFHYAGHEFFDEASPDRGGLVLADSILAAADIPAAALQLVFLSTCESARLRDVSIPASAPTPAPCRTRGKGRSVAEAFLRAGVRAFIGTFCAVDDDDACCFASVVHRELAAGRTLGDAMRAARRALHGSRSPDWGNFLLYGDDSLIL